MQRSRAWRTVPMPSGSTRKASRARLTISCATAPGRRWASPLWWVQSWGFWRPAALRAADMRLLWSLPKAAPALLRHLAAYVDLAGLDLAKAQGEIAAQLLAWIVVAVCALFAVLMGCLLVVAYTW